MRGFALALLVSASLACGCVTTVPAPEPSAHPRAKGPKAPNFSLLSPDGEKVDFTAGARYEVTVISFWSPSWDPDHTALLDQLKLLRGQARDKPLRLLLVCYDEEPENIRRYLKDHPQEADVAMGDTKVYELFHLEDLPTTILVSPDGSVIETLKGHPAADEIFSRISRFFPQ